MAIKSTDQAKNRMIGPASKKENSMPSGVLMVSVFVCPILIHPDPFAFFSEEQFHRPLAALIRAAKFAENFFLIPFR
jgi:hypothetical protein